MSKRTSRWGNNSKTPSPVCPVCGKGESEVEVARMTQVADAYEYEMNALRMVVRSETARCVMAENQRDEAAKSAIGWSERAEQAESELAALKTENKKLKCCGNCKWHGEWPSSFCQDDINQELEGDGKEPWPHDPCHFAPSRWEARP